MRWLHALLLSIVSSAVIAEQWDYYAPTTSATPYESLLHSENDAERLYATVRLVDYYRSSKPTLALQLVTQGLELSTLAENRGAQSLLLCYGAWASSVIGDTNNALQRLERGLVIAREHKEEHALARCYNTEGLLAIRIGDYTEALDHFAKSLQIENQIGDDHHAGIANSNIGFTNGYLARYDEALTYYDRAIAIAERTQDSTLLMIARDHKANTLLDMKRYQEALLLAQKNYEMPEVKKQAVRLAGSLHNMGSAYAYLGQFEQAERHLNQSLALRRDIGDLVTLNETQRALAILYWLEHRYADAEHAFDAVIADAKKLGNARVIRDCISAKMDMYVALKQYEKAIALNKEYVLAESSLSSQRASYRLAQMQVRIKESENERHIAVLTRENEIQRLRVENQRQILWAVLAGFLFFVSIAFFLWWRVRQRRLAAEAAVIARSQHLAQMSHEIRTPMTAIMGVAELLHDTPLNGEQRELINTIRFSSESLLALVNDILDLSKIDAGKFHLAQQPFDLQQTLENAADLFAFTVERKHLQLTVFMPLSAPTQFVGDEHRLRQILVNLISNAIKFTDKGRVAVSASVQVNAQQALITIAVQDTGIGVSEAQIQQLFEPFEQADQRQEVRVRGSGLGLAISRQLARLMGGDIQAQSVLGAGSTFSLSVSLPLAESVATPTNMGVAFERVLLFGFADGYREWLEQFCKELSLPCLVCDMTGLLNHQLSANDAVLLAWTDFNSAMLLAVINECRQRGARVAVLAGPAARAHRDALQTGEIEFLGLPPRRSQLQPFLQHHHSKVNAEVVTASEAPARVTRRRALIVDDNEVNRKVAAKLLTKLDFESVAVDGGLAALSALERQRFDVILMDCQMPEMDGYETTRRIREWESEIGFHHLIIAVTANALKGDREKCLASGMDDYIAKPVKLDTIEVVLSRHFSAV